MELIYDLGIVVIIAKLGHLLVESLSLQHVLQFVLLFIPVYIVWNGSTYYNERFETRRLENRLFFFLKIVSVSVMAIFVHDAFGEQAAGMRLVTGNSISMALFVIIVLGVACVIVAVLPVPYPSLVLLAIFLLVFGINMTYGALVRM